MALTQYVAVYMKCIHCDFVDYLHLTQTEINEQNSMNLSRFCGAGIQCEDFWQHFDVHLSTIPNDIMYETKLEYQFYPCQVIEMTKKQRAEYVLKMQ